MSTVLLVRQLALRSSRLMPRFTQDKVREISSANAVSGIAAGEGLTLQLIAAISAWAADIALNVERGVNWTSLAGTTLTPSAKVAQKFD